MIKTYNFSYNSGPARIIIEVDLDLFIKEMQTKTLLYCKHNIDKDRNKLDIISRNYILGFFCNAYKVKDISKLKMLSLFKRKKGVYFLNGCYGIKFISINGYDFNRKSLHLMISNDMVLKKWQN